ncbi:Protein AKTIP-like [Exaiptasia diaphana]|nr:Protein AKTIP-like [Exaiptasia diaphana]
MLNVTHQLRKKLFLTDLDERQSPPKGSRQGEQEPDGTTSSNDEKSRKFRKSLPSLPSPEEEKSMNLSVARQRSPSTSTPVPSKAYGPYFLEYTLMAEYNQLRSKRIPGVYVLPAAKSPLVWYGVIFIRMGDYQDGIFKFTMTVPDNFPDGDCPKFEFKPPIFHPVVNMETGELDVKRAFPKWRRNINHLWQVLIYSRRIFYKIDTKEPLNPEAANLYENDKVAFKYKVNECLPPTQKPNISKAPPKPEPPKPEPPIVLAQTKNIVPSERNRPAGLHMSDFLPPNPVAPEPEPYKDNNFTPPVPQLSESESLNMLSKSHMSILSIMSARQRNLSVIAKYWGDGEIKSAIQTAVNMNDSAILVDVLNVLCLKQTLWNLDICLIILPQLKDLFISKYESYAQAAASALKLILRNFAPVIKSNMSAPPDSIGVDLVREERYNKCQACHAHLRSLKTVISNKTALTGKMGSLFRELSLAFSAVD